ncbi:unnamed protein product [marine sediment metagenome]|uniref:KOW domain-containing protein n=1 Tax=marine sediment metagenome TaxID=412755 RepID=X0S566_9ZZZZ
MKFKVGDRVRVRPDSKQMPKYAGKVGTVKTVTHGVTTRYPYAIRFDCISAKVFHANELVKEE